MVIIAALVAAPPESLADDAPADSATVSVAPLSLPAPPVRRWQTGALRPDRLTHMSLALGIGVGVGMTSRAPIVGAAAAVGLGIAKEFSDDHVDRGDLAADAIGAGLAALIVAALTR